MTSASHDPFHHLRRSFVESLAFPKQRVRCSRLIHYLSSFVCACWLSACIELSPFETDLEAHERDLTRQNIAKLEARPEPREPLRFAVISDSHQAWDELSDVVTHLNQREDLAFVVHLGDMTTFGLRHEFRQTLAQLRKLSVPFLTVIGNHDAISNGKIVYRAMFGPYDYSFEYGQLRFVALNTNPLEFGAGTPDLAWLSAAIETDDRRPVVVLTHQPPKNGGYELDFLERHGVSALISAHDHAASLSDERGLLRVTVDDAWSRHWTEVTLEDGALTVAQCSPRGCEPQAP